MLSMFVNDRRDNWNELLPFVMHAYCTSVHESTGYSPFRLMMGEECSLPQYVSTYELRTHRKHNVAPQPFATWVRDALEVAYDHVRHSLHRTAARRKRLYDNKNCQSQVPGGIVGVVLLPAGRPKEIGISLDRPPTSCTQSYQPYSGHSKGTSGPHPPVMHAYCTSVHKSTGYSPFRLMMGECSLPQDVSTYELRTHREHDVAPHPFATWVRDAVEVAYDHVRHLLHRTAARRKRLYDKKNLSITGFRWDRGCCVTTRRPPKRNWDIPG